MSSDLGRDHLRRLNGTVGRGGARMPASWWRELRRAVLWHRRLLAAGLAALAVALTIAALEPPAPRTVQVIAAAHDIIGGERVDQSDLVTVSVPAAFVPDGALVDASAAIGRSTAGPVRRGEALTDVRLLGPALVAGFGPGVVATPVRIQDAAALTLVRPGDHIDVLATPATTETAGEGSTVVAADVAVVAVPSGSAASAYDDGGLIVLATTPAQAADLAVAAVTDRLSIVVRAD